jgi:hypothetical protein
MAKFANNIDRDGCGAGVQARSAALILGLEPIAGLLHCTTET